MLINPTHKAVSLIQFALAVLLVWQPYPVVYAQTLGRGQTKAAHRNSNEIVISFAGDCTFGTVNGDNSNRRFPSVYHRSGHKDYPFALVKPLFKNDDLTTVNFECTLTNASPTADKQWHFKGDASYAAIFKEASIDAVGLSNNHSFDYLQKGFDDTVHNFRHKHVGIYYKGTPYITKRKGVEIVLIGDCTVVGENTTVIDGAPKRVVDAIKRYKKPNNIVIVVMHWGSELDKSPCLWQQQLGRKFIDSGADAVVGHHPHVLQGIERYKGKYIAYSLGNFAFGGNSLARNPDTIILRLHFTVSRGTTHNKKAEIIPCLVTSSKQRKHENVLINNYQPIPVEGEEAKKIAGLVVKRSAALKYGIKKIDYKHFIAR